MGDGFLQDGEGAGKDFVLMIVASSSGEGFGVLIREVHDMAYAVLPYLSVLSPAVRVV